MTTIKKKKNYIPQFSLENGTFNSSIWLNEEKAWKNGVELA
jgi:hypothetical protein